MPAPNAPTGTPPRRRRRPDDDPFRPDRRNPNGPNQHPGASTPPSTPPGQQPEESSIFDLEALNPPFDPRMRRIGSPLNQADKIKRGWIQDKEGTKRVNFLFNPSSQDLSHSTDPSVVLEEDRPADDTALDPDYASTASSTSVKLLYDRTYEMFSPPKGGKIGFANKYGVWADVAAWYTYLKMIPEYPTSWEDSMLTQPMSKFFSYLFVGPTMCYYGYVTGMSVTYSHWSQNMVPVRCAVDIGFQIMPFSGRAPIPGQAASWTPFDGWLGSFFHLDNPADDEIIDLPDFIPGDEDIEVD